jgi:DNA-binding MarR family transcriptional regulator
LYRTSIPASTQATADLTDDERRVGTAMRELRRGAGMQRLRDVIYGDDPDALDIGQQDALEVLAAVGPVRMSELAGALRVDASTATRAVARLEAARLVERARAEDDGRSVVVFVTPRGEARLERLGTIARTALRQLFAEFAPDELTRLADLLERLVGAVDTLLEPD